MSRYIYAMDNDEWVHVGAEVASVRLGQQKAVEFSKIARIGARWLFLENGEKFHVLGHDRNEGGSVGGTVYKLFPADHERVKRMQLDIETRKIMSTAIQSAKMFVENPNTANAEKTILALLPFTEYVLQSKHDDAD